MVKCSFCGIEESPHKGLHLIKNDGSINYFCSSKCRRNSLNLRRDKRKIKWTSAFHETREKANQRKAEEAEKKAEEKAEKKVIKQKTAKKKSSK